MADELIEIRPEEEIAGKPQRKKGVRKEPPQAKRNETSEPLPEIPDELPRNINFNTDNDKSRAAYTYSLAKFMVIMTAISADMIKQPPVMMQDEEALNIAMPAMIILMRMKWFIEMMSTYGQYVVSLDEWIMLIWFLYAYQARVRKELNHEPVQRGNALGPKQADNGRYADIGEGPRNPAAAIRVYGREA